MQVEVGAENVSITVKITQSLIIQPPEYVQLVYCKINGNESEQRQAQIGDVIELAYHKTHLIWVPPVEDVEIRISYQQHMISCGDEQSDGTYVIEDTRHQVYYANMDGLAQQTVTHGFITSGGTSTVKAHLLVPVQNSIVLQLLSKELQKAYEFINSYIGVSFPFKSYKMAFADHTLGDQLQGPSLSLLSSVYLCNEVHNVQFRVIESVAQLRQKMSFSLASQWFGAYIYPKTKADCWLIRGISGYISKLYHQSVYGYNDHKYRLLQDMAKLCEMKDPVKLNSEAVSEEILEVKAPLVIYMLSRFIGRIMMQRILNRIVVAGISGELSEGLSSQSFFKTVKKISGKETKYFFDQWISGCGMPQLTATHHFNRKKNIIELKITQLNKDCLYNGNVTIRVHEPEGTYDHVIRVEDVTHHFDLNYHTKYKRLRIANKIAQQSGDTNLIEQDAIQGLQPPAGCELDEVMNQMDPELSGIIAGTKYDENDPETLLLNSPINWIRLDPDLDLCFRIDFTSQTEYMDIQQLQRDRDIMAQLEVIRRFGKAPVADLTERMVNNLVATVVDVRLYYGVRIEAVRALGRFECMRFLMMVYRKKFCISSSSVQGLVPRRNDFSVQTEYFLQMSIPEVMATIRDGNDHCMESIQRIIVNIIRFNDNSANQFSDVFYLASLIKALGRSFIPKASMLSVHQEKQPKSSIFEEALSEVDRHLFLETQVPTWQNVVACACLETLKLWRLYELLPEDYMTLKPFLLFSAPSNFDNVRLVCFDALACFGYSLQHIWDYMLNILEHDGINLRLCQQLAALFWFLKKEHEAEMDIRYQKAAADYSRRASQEKLMVDVEDLSGGNAMHEEVAGTVSDYDILKKFYQEFGVQLQKRMFQISTSVSKENVRLVISLLDAIEGLQIKEEMSTDIKKLKLQLPPKPVEPVVPKVRLLLKPSNHDLAQPEDLSRSQMLPSEDQTTQEVTVENEPQQPSADQPAIPKKPVFKLKFSRPKPAQVQAPQIQPEVSTLNEGQKEEPVEVQPQPLPVQEASPEPQLESLKRKADEEKPAPIKKAKTEAFRQKVRMKTFQQISTENFINRLLSKQTCDDDQECMSYLHQIKSVNSDRLVCRVVPFTASRNGMIRDAAYTLLQQLPYSPDALMAMNSIRRDLTNEHHKSIAVATQLSLLVRSGDIEQARQQIVDGLADETSQQAILGCLTQFQVIQVLKGKDWVLQELRKLELTAAVAGVIIIYSETIEQQETLEYLRFSKILSILLPKTITRTMDETLQLMNCLDEKLETDLVDVVVAVVKWFLTVSRDAQMYNQVKIRVSGPVQKIMKFCGVDQLMELLHIIVAHTIEGLEIADFILPKQNEDRQVQELKLYALSLCKPQVSAVDCIKPFVADHGRLAIIALKRHLSSQSFVDFLLSLPPSLSLKHLYHTQELELQESQVIEFFKSSKDNESLYWLFKLSIKHENLDSSFQVALAELIRDIIEHDQDPVAQVIRNALNKSIF